MKVRTFIDRPILSGVISVLIVLVGLIALSRLPLEQFPEIAPPTVRINANYTGANAETVMKSVVVPLEEAINGVEGMMFMSSRASNTGNANISVFFRQGTDPDMAMVNVQNRAATVQGRLPSDVVKGGLTVRKRQSTNIKQITVYSPDDSFDRTFLANYTKINIEPRLSRIAGVGEVNVIGADYSMRIWLDPMKMARYGLSTGTLGADSPNTFQYILKYRGTFEEEQGYEQMVVRSLPNGDVLRIGDIAKVELGSQNYNYIGETNGHPSVNVSINQVSGSNANEIIEQADREVEEIRAGLPPGIAIDDLESKKDFLDASIKSVLRTLLEAMLLVILVVYLFLQSFRSTLIPAVAIGVSLIGTLAVLYAIGFSLNMLTLFALVLVIGTVVDDAIVVVEAVQAQFDVGERSAYEATTKAMGGITSALVTTTLVFMAVFVPVCFINGVTGTFYTQFGLTMAIAVAISLFNALTLSPALCALIMTPHADEEKGEKLSFSSRFHLAFDAAFHRMVLKYKKMAGWLFRHLWLSALLVVVAAVGLSMLMKSTKTGLVPKEDMGTIYVLIGGGQQRRFRPVILQRQFHTETEKMG